MAVVGGRAELDATGGHVLRFDTGARIVEAWGWCADQPALDAFLAEPPDAQGG